jgi:hypothetical protein
MNDLVSKAEFARELGCSRSTITDLVERGMPIHSGKIDRGESLRWITTYFSGSAGGWGSSRGESVYDKAQRLLNRGTRKQPSEHRLLDEIRRRIFRDLPRGCNTKCVNGGADYSPSITSAFNRSPKMTAS